ncbi:hypothetical protein [Ruegeria sp.]|uniref:hypothetical protein n=1 Tax=Ruegeria sp. TaxID=1879320 RepID=UPI003B5902F5
MFFIKVVVESSDGLPRRGDFNNPTLRRGNNQPVAVGKALVVTHYEGIEREVGAMEKIVTWAFQRGICCFSFSFSLRVS